MNVKEIKSAIESGKSVFWLTSNYRVIKDSIGQFLIHSQANDDYVGLTRNDGKLNEKESDFYVI